jgi:hypothetical protein
MKYLYLDIKNDCEVCEGSGMGKWCGNDCVKCLKEIDLSMLSNSQLESLKKEIQVKLNGVCNCNRTNCEIC